MERNHTDGPAYGAAALATICVFSLYALTLAPTTAFWDTSEYIATAHIMGIPHPPGNPLFVILARTWDVLLTPLGLPVAVRINLFSAAMSALAHGCWFLLAERVLTYFPISRVTRMGGAGAAVLMSATAFTVWNQSNVNEKVYTVSLLTIALLSWLMFMWRDRARASGSDNILVLIVFLLALSVGNHLMAFLAAPAIGVFVLLVRPRVLLSWKLYAMCIPAAILGLSVHLYLPLRAELQPVVNQADPRCETLGSAFVSVLTFGRRGCGPLSESLARRQYDKPSMFDDPIAAAQRIRMPRSPQLLGAQLMNYAQYFDWQWARSASGHEGWFGGLRPLITLLFGLLGTFGAWSHWKHDRSSSVFVAVLFITLSFGLTFYMNFRYGFVSPWRDAAASNIEVRERDYFFIVSFSLWGLWCGIGLVALWQPLAARIVRPQWAAAVFAIALVPLLANWTWASRRNDYAARDWSYNLLMSAEPYAVLVTNGDNDTFPLWYLQEVEGIRRDVTVIVMSYLNTAWYAKQLRDLTTPCGPGEDPAQDPTRITCQRPYVPPTGADIYPVEPPRGDAAGVSLSASSPGTRPPAHTMLALTDAQIDALSLNAFVSPAATYRAGKISTEIQEGTTILPADIFLAEIIKSSIGDRPIYFAMTTGAYNTLNLKDYMVRRGVAYKLMNGPVKEDRAAGIFELPFGADAPVPRFVDVPRTEVLLHKIFRHHAGFPDEWTHWTDVATNDVPQYYASAIHAIAYAYGISGDMARWNSLTAEAQRFERLGNIRLKARPATE